MFTFIIISTIDIQDHADAIKVGDALYTGDNDERFETAADAVSAGEAVLNGLDGHKAFNMARDSAEIVAVEV